MFLIAAALLKRLQFSTSQPPKGVLLFFYLQDSRFYFLNSLKSRYVLNTSDQVISVFLLKLQALEK